ncbi:MAG: hypothetical protein H5T94_04170 [Pseudothermotoga sp.]|nr:hypothetical protein [Pseudothermotoga sp.]
MEVALNNAIRISTRGIFIHGGTIQVEFEYFDKPRVRELGDLIFVLTVNFHHRKYLEKFTVTQLKKGQEDKYGANRLSLESAGKEQMYLLSRFPRFKVTRGILNKKEYLLQNYSGCLGSIGVFFKPGDMLIISAKTLEGILGGRSSITQRQLTVSMTASKFVARPCCCRILFCSGEIEEALWKSEPLRLFCSLCQSIACSDCFAGNVYEFSWKFLGGFIGEPTFVFGSKFNTSALGFLNDLLTAANQIVQKSPRHQHQDRILMANTQSGSGYVADHKNVSNHDERGFGIIQTTIEVEE